MLTLKILKKYSIKAFFFINTKFVGSKKTTPELIRFFIYNHCKGIKNFYNIFENNCNLNVKKIIKDNKKKIQFYKSKYKFYTIQDIKFRIIRNSISQKKYFFIMEKIMKNEKFNYNILKYKPYMSEKDLIKINKNGHLVGLHTHSHPSDFSCLSSKDQKKELFLNIKSLKRILKNKNELFETFSYPAGNYSRQTLRILKDLNIKIAFTNSIETKTNNVLETPRINHKYLIKHIK